MNNKTFNIYKLTFILYKLTHNYTDNYYKKTKTEDLKLEKNKFKGIYKNLKDIIIKD